MCMFPENRVLSVLVSESKRISYFSLVPSPISNDLVDWIMFVDLVSRSRSKWLSGKLEPWLKM